MKFNRDILLLIFIYFNFNNIFVSNLLLIIKYDVIIIRRISNHKIVKNLYFYTLINSRQRKNM